MTILVTGGAGFIGANFILYMMKAHRDLRILCLDKLTYAADLSYLAPVAGSPRFRFVKGDICDRDAVYQLFEEEHPDVVVNFAAESHVDRSIEDPSLFLKTNILGTGVLLDGCRTCGIRRFHQVSTDEVYGDLPLGRPDLLFTEESPLDPHSPYSSSKASADLLALAYRRTYGIPVTISRCSNNYGPFQYPEKLIPLTIKRALQDRPIPTLRRRQKRAGLALRRRPLPGHRPHPPERKGRRNLQHRRPPGDLQQRPHPPHPPYPRQAGHPHHPGPRPPGSRQKVRHGHTKNPHPPGLAGGNGLRRRTEADGCMVCGAV